MSRQDLDELIEGFEHEFDVLTENLEITKPFFDGRIGDPTAALKLALTRYVKHHHNRIVAAKVADAEIAAAIKEHESIRWSPSELSFIERQADRLAQLQRKQGGNDVAQK